MSNGNGLASKRVVVPNLAKGVLVAVCVSIAGIFAFALVLKFVNFSDLVIKIINQVIKILSVFFGVNVALKNNKSKALFKGLLVGVLYTALSYLIFSLLVSSFSFGLNFVYDVLFLGLAGLLSGAIKAVSKR